MSGPLSPRRRCSWIANQCAPWKWIVSTTSRGARAGWYAVGRYSVNFRSNSSSATCSPGKVVAGGPISRRGIGGGVGSAARRSGATTVSAPDEGVEDDDGDAELAQPIVTCARPRTRTAAATCLTIVAAILPRRPPSVAAV
jgi:hypothetical protein